MNTTIRIFWVLGTLLALVACHDVKKQQQLDEVNRLIGLADSIGKVWEMERTDPVEDILPEVREVEEKIRKDFGSDTISVEMGQKLEDYKMISKGLAYYLSNDDALRFGPRQVKLTLNALKHDIEAASGDRSKYAQDIAFEKNKVDQLNVLLKSCVETKSKCVNSYQHLHTEIKAFSESL